MIDLFAGAGGFTLGMKEAGFEPVFAVEREADFVRTYEENFGSHCVGRDIESLVEGLKNESVDLKPAENGIKTVGLTPEDYVESDGKRGVLKQQ